MFRKAALRKSVEVRVPGQEQSDAPTVLFVCVHNAGRSRMAEAFFNDLAAGRYRAISAGTEPAERIHPEVVRSMTEAGVEMRDGPGTRLTQELADDAELVVGMGCAVEEACPALQVPLQDWDLEDPKGRSPKEVAAIRDEIESRVRNLIAQLDRERTQT